MSRRFILAALAAVIPLAAACDPVDRDALRGCAVVVPAETDVPTGWQYTGGEPGWWSDSFGAVVGWSDEEDGAIYPTPDQARVCPDYP